MTKKRKTNHGSAVAFRKAWKRAHDGQKDSWGVEYVYEFGARRLWNAALRFARTSKGVE
jgi:hypothetical protein